MWQLLVSLLRGGRWRDAERATVTDDQCVSCDSKELEPLGPGAYRCRKCGYEGGSGYSAVADAVREQEVAGWAIEERREGALEDLRDARTELVSARVALPGGDAAEGVPAAQAAIANGHLVAARRALRDADSKLVGLAVATDLSFVAEAGWDGPLSPAALAEAPVDAELALSALLQQVEAAVRELEREG